MPTSTTTLANPRVMMRTPIVARPTRFRRLVDPAAVEQGFCSPAGLHRRPWLARLRRALAEDLFVLHYQPIVSLTDGSVSHHEALLRLADEPDGNLIAPNSFLPAAERYGLIRDIDRMVLRKVSELLGGEHGRRGMRIAMNVSAVSASDPAMLAHLERALVRERVDPSLLVVEVTETAAISDMASAKAFCAGVLALGCEVALDDFGAGFGSFQYLKHLPFSYLKIDGDFIRRLPASRTDQLVVEALAGLVRGMGARTVAEFVSDKPTISMLRLFGVDYGQGFELGRPEPLSSLQAGPL
jgi:EAL domain-containing protein (putative c-di-GMP-specific phosphodiesterase class I)